MRKPLNKAFNPKILESFMPVFNEKVKFLIRNLEEKLNKDYFDVTPFIYNCTLDMVCGECFPYFFFFVLLFGQF